MRKTISFYPRNANFQQQLNNLLLKQRQRDQRQRDQAHGQARIKSHTSLAPPPTSKAPIASKRDPLSAAMARRAEAEAIVATHTHMLEQYNRQTTEATLGGTFEVCQPPIKDNADVNVDIASERAAQSHWTPIFNAARSQS